MPFRREGEFTEKCCQIGVFEKKSVGILKKMANYVGRVVAVSSSRYCPTIHPSGNPIPIQLSFWSFCMYNPSVSLIRTKTTPAPLDNHLIITEPRCHLHARPTANVMILSCRPGLPTRAGIGLYILLSNDQCSLLALGCVGSNTLCTRY